MQVITDFYSPWLLEEESKYLTFLASHSCLGRGLLTPNRFSSLGMVGKEKTADRKAHLNIMPPVQPT